MWDKLKLENLIFQKAYVAKERIYGKNGALFSSGREPCLQALLKVYNQFFSAENWRVFNEPEESLLIHYLTSSPFYRGGLVPFGSVLSEILVQEKINTYLKKALCLDQGTKRT